MDKLIREKLETLTFENIDELSEHLPAKSDSLIVLYMHRILENQTSSAQVQRLLANFEIAADKDLGTLIPMGPALVGFSAGDIASMAYNMQVAFATTVIGLFAGAIGFLTQQVKQRWYLQDLTNLDFLAEILTEKRNRL